MRLAGQAKLGYYPASPLAIKEIVKHLYCRGAVPEKRYDTINILDPCAGEGLAIKQIGEALAVPTDHTYAVELDAERYNKVKENIPGVKVVDGPASFLGIQVTGYSFGLVYVNPPFDSELGGGRREEQAFTEKAARLLVRKGILVLVAPMRAVNGNRSFCSFLDANFEDIQVYKFPDGWDEEADKSIRSYNEIVIIGKKRPETIPSDAYEKLGRLHQMNFQWNGYTRIEALPSVGQAQPKFWNNGTPSYDREEHIQTWEIPHSWKPHTFKKTTFTDMELADVIRKSPLNDLLKEVTIPPLSAPPLPLDKGHLGLILASGMLDGVVNGPHGAHVVRGSSHKVEYYNQEASDSHENPDTGAVTTKDVFSQRMVTTIRVVEQDGVIQTFSNDKEAKASEEEEESL